MSQFDVKNDVQNGVILPDVHDDCLPAEYSKTVVTRLPTLQIHHDEDKVRDLKGYYRKEQLISDLGTLFCIVVWFLSIGITARNTYGIVICLLMLGVSVIFVIYLHEKISSNKASYYYQFLKEEIDAFAEVKHLCYGRTVFNLSDSDTELAEMPQKCKNLNWLSCNVDEHLFEELNIVGNKWTELVVHDDIVGDYAG